MTFRTVLIVLAATIFGTPSAEAGLPSFRTIESLSEAAHDSKNANRPFTVTGTVQYCCLANFRRSTIDILSPGGKQMRLYELSPKSNDDIRLGDTIAVSGIVTTNDVGNWSANYTNVQILARHGPYRKISGMQFFDNANRHKIMILTSFGSSDDISRALAAGAAGAILKDASNEDLIDSIKRVAAGEKVVPENIRRMIAEDPPLPELSQRQMEILSSITRGLTNTDIAKQLGIGVTSVKTHMEALFLKIGAANRAETVAIALRKHLLKI